MRLIIGRLLAWFVTPVLLADLRAAVDKADEEAVLDQMIANPRSAR